jgi:hypothetical protein
MGSRCRTCSGEERCIHDFGGGNLREDIGVDGRIISELILKE